VKSRLFPVESATSNGAWIRNCKTCLLLLPHRLQLNTATDTCLQLQQLLICLYVWKPVAK